YADPPQGLLGAAGKGFREGTEDARRALEQDDGRLRRIDPTKVASDGSSGDLTEGAGQLDAGGTAADDHEREQCLALDGIVLALGGLVGQQHAAADLLCLLDALESGGRCLRVLVAEVRGAGAG